MMNYTFKIWDKKSPVNGFSANKVIDSLQIQAEDQVYILVDPEGFDRIVQTQNNAPYPGETIEESAQNHIAAIQKEDEKQRQQELTLEEKIAVQREMLNILMGGTYNG